MQLSAFFMDIDVENAEYGSNNKTDRSKRQTEASVTGKLSRRGIREVNVPAQSITRTLTVCEGQDQTADVRNGRWTFPKLYVY